MVFADASVQTPAMSPELSMADVQLSVKPVGRMLAYLAFRSVMAPFSQIAARQESSL